MVRITKLTDYAIVVLAYLANQHESWSQSSEIAEHTHLPHTTISKILKILTKSGFCQSLRGTQGGYRLKAIPNEISVYDIITALEGPMAITECNLGNHSECPTEKSCALRKPWFHINQVISSALRNVSLFDLLGNNEVHLGTNLPYTQLIESRPLRFQGDHYVKHN